MKNYSNWRVYRYWFALHFSNLYPSRCLKVVFLEGAYIDSNNNDFKRIKIIK